MKKIFYTLLFLGIFVAHNLYADNCQQIPYNPNIEMCIVITPKNESYSAATDPFEKNCSEFDFFTATSVDFGTDNSFYLDNRTSDASVVPFVKNQTYEISVSLSIRNNFVFLVNYPFLEFQWYEYDPNGGFVVQDFSQVTYEVDPFDAYTAIYEHTFEFTPTENTISFNGTNWEYRGLRMDLLARNFDGVVQSNDSFSSLIPFITTGPKTNNIAIENTSQTPAVPYVVLHDPPGDQSFSSMMANVEHCQTVSWSTANDLSAGVWAKAKVGTKISNSFLGLAEIETEVFASLEGSFTTTFSNNAAGETERCFSTSSTFSTSPDNNAINGERGDVFIGKSILMSMGLAENISYQCGAPDIKKELVIAPTGINTEFAYTEDYIKSVLIPDLQNTLNNSDETSGAYKTALRQKEVWDQALAYNDELKQGFVTKTHVFNAGANQSHTESVSTSEIKTIETSIDMDTNLAIAAGVEVAGVGVSGGANIRMRSQTGFGSGSASNTENVISYTLSDGDNTTSGIGSDKFTIGVIHDAKHGTPAFVLLDGETSCPYEGGYQIDQPKLQFNDGNNVISANGVVNETLVLPIQICNDSKYDRNYHLKLDNNSNANGLLIDVAGTTLNSTDEGHLFLSVPAEGCFDQNLIINSPAASLTDFSGIEIYLYACSENTSTDGQTIVSTVQLNVTFGQAAPAYNEACGAINLPTDGSLQGPFDNITSDADEAELQIVPPGTGCNMQNGWCEDALFIENSVWFTFTAPSSGEVEVSVCGLADFDTQMAVYEVANCSDFSAYSLVAANDDGPDACATDFDSYLDIQNLNPGQTYYILIDGYQGATGTFDIFVKERINTSANYLDVSAQVSVFPNPCVESFSIRTSEEFQSLQLYNMTGQVVLTVDDPSVINGAAPIALPQLGEGLFMGVLSGDQKQANFKLTVIHE